MATPLLIQFENAPDLKTFLDTLLPKADAGDASAQYYVAKTFEACMQYSADPTRFMAIMQEPLQAPAYPNGKPIYPIGVPGMPGQNQSGFREMMERRFQRCKSFARGELKNLQKEQWYEKAAINGNIAAFAHEMNVDLILHPDDWSPEQTKSAVNMILASHDPIAIFELAGVMGEWGGKDRWPGVNPLDVFGPYSGGFLDSYAWTLAACDLGYPCGAGSAIVDNQCFNMQLCGYVDFRSFLKDVYLSPMQYLALEARRKDIIDYIAGHP